MTIHQTTEGIEFESSEMESKEPDKAAIWDETKPRVDWEGAWRALDKELSYATGPFYEIHVIRRLMNQTLDAHTTPPSKPETLESVVREYVTLVPGCGAFGANAERATALFYKLREIVKEK